HREHLDLDAALVRHVVHRGDQGLLVRLLVLPGQGVDGVAVRDRRLRLLVVRTEHLVQRPHLLVEVVELGPPVDAEAGHDVPRVDPHEQRLVRGGRPGGVCGIRRRSRVRGRGDVRGRGRRVALQRHLELAGELDRQLEVGRYVEEVAVVRVRGRGGGCGGGQDRARQGTARGRYDSRRPGLCRGGYGALDEGRPARLVTELLDIVRRHRRPSIASARPPGCSTTK